MADTPALRQDVVEGDFIRGIVGCADDASAPGIAYAARSRSSHAFRGADRLAIGDRLRGRAGADDCGSSAGIVRTQYASLDRPGKDTAGAGIVVAGASAGAGDARPAGFLARQL